MLADATPSPGLTPITALPCTSFSPAQVVESLKRCGIHDDTQHVLVAMFDATPEDVSVL